ncbi:MAG: acylphosphatase [Halobacteria archaeon]
MFQAHIFAHGRVQGVNFRYYVQRKAEELGLKGYVRNLSDGRVEILAQGSRDNLKELISYVRSSPGLSFVTDLEVSWEEAKVDLGGFRIRF